MIKVIAIILLFCTSNASAFGWARAVRFSSGTTGGGSTPGPCLTTATVSGMKFWYKADNGTSSTQNNTAITYWQDASSTQDHLVNYDGNPKYYTNVQNSKPGVYFNGVSSMWGADIGDIAQPNTFFIVFQPESWPAAGNFAVPFETGVTANFWAIAKNNGDTRTVLNSGNVMYGDTVSAPNTYLATSIINGASSSLKINASSAVSGNAGANNNEMRPWCGSGKGGLNRYVGYVLEVILYDTALSAENQSIIQGCLNTKYAIY